MEITEEVAQNNSLASGSTKSAGNATPLRDEPITALSPMEAAAIESELDEISNSDHPIHV